MEQAELQQEVIDLIGRDELRQAGERLAEHWQGSSPSLQQAALAQIRRLRTLEEKRIKGVLSEDDANVEHARITDALLALSRQLTAEQPEVPEGLATAPGGVKKGWIVGGLAAALAAVAFLWITASGPSSDAFDVTINAQLAEDAAPVSGGKLKIVLGNYHLQPKDLNSDGQVIFNEIPAEYLDDSLHIIPVDLPYVVADQSALSASQSRHITVSMTPKPQQTLWRGQVVDHQRRGVAGAQIDIGNGLAVTTSDSLGNFRAAVPLPDNSWVKVVVRIDGAVRSDRQVTISEQTPATLIIND